METISYEDPLYRKYSNLATKLVAEPIVYEFTEDPALLHQYYLIRARMFREKLGANLTPEPDAHDRLSHILIARKDKLCIGGVRLTVREADEKWLLPLERDDFILKEKLPQLELDKYRHAEISRFAILEDYNSKEVLYETCKALNKYVKDMDIEYIFCRSVIATARLWRKLTDQIGNYSCEILELEAPPLSDSDRIFHLLVGVASHHTINNYARTDLVKVDL